MYSNSIQLSCKIPWRSHFQKMASFNNEQFGCEGLLRNTEKLSIRRWLSSTVPWKSHMLPRYQGICPNSSKAVTIFSEVPINFPHPQACLLQGKPMKPRLCVPHHPEKHTGWGGVMESDTWYHLEEIKALLDISEAEFGRNSKVYKMKYWSPPFLSEHVQV